MALATLLQPFYRLVSPTDNNNGPTDAEKVAVATEEADPRTDTRRVSTTTRMALYDLNDLDELATTQPGDVGAHSSSWSNSRGGSVDHDIGPSGTGPLSPQDSSPEMKTNEVRSLPLISSIFVPFSILLALPGLTEHWYIRTDDQHRVIQIEQNSLFFRVVVGISLGCAILTNICLLVRLVGKSVKAMTISCIIALSVHDVLSIVVIILFIIKTQTDDGFILGEAFWTTVCSTIASLVTNVTLILDYFTTPNFAKSGSGLTKKQRSLTIIIIVLLCYVAFGAAVHTALLDLSFVDALYFSIVCIETIGFGDINPQTTGSRIFATIYTVFGILILAVAIGLIREAILENIQANLYSHIRAERRRRVMRRWLEGIRWRLENTRLPVWVPIEDEPGTDDDEWPREMELGNGRWRRLWWKCSDSIGAHVPIRRSLRSNNDRRRKRLNLRALTEAQLRAAAMEAGAPLQELLPRHPDHLDHYDHPDNDYVLDSGQPPISPTHHHMGRMIAVLGTFAFAVGAGRDVPRTANVMESQQESPQSNGGSGSGVGPPTMLADLEKAERRMFAARVSFALSLFMTFWLVGSAVFMATEKWSFSLALYFCFITFTTVGYGDPVPRTPAGRSFFVGWALAGVGTMTILISFLADRYSERYQNIIDAAESTVAADDGLAKTQSLTTPAPPVSNRVMSSNATAGIQSPMAIGNEEKESLTGEKMLSRIDALKEMVVDEGAYRDGTLFHSLESELQTMLTLIRRSRGRRSQDDIEET